MNADEMERFERTREKLGIPDDEEALELAICEAINDVDHDTLRRVFLAVFEDNT